MTRIPLDEEDVVGIQPDSYMSWGFLPQIMVTCAAGLLFVAGVNTAARLNYAWSDSFWWFGLLLIYVPSVLRQLMTNVSRRERVGIVVVTGFALYMVKILNSPDSFAMHDELLHWKTVDTITYTFHLFTPNPLLPVSPLYPGLHLITVSITQILGVNIFTAGALVLGTMRVVLGLSLYHLMNYASKSPRVAGLAALVYMGNANFVFFMSQFAYESLALPLGVLFLAIIVRRNDVEGNARVILNICMVMIALTISMTHHVTSFAIVGLLGGTVLVRLLWPPLATWLDKLSEWFKRRWLYKKVVAWFIPPSQIRNEYPHIRPRPVLGWTALLVTLLTLSWMAYVATPTFGYLTPIFSEAFNELGNMLNRESGGRELFAAKSGVQRPAWEKFASLGSVALTALVIPFGLIEVWRRHRDQMVSIVLAFAGIGYFGALALRLTEKGWEISNRSSEFLFLGVGFLSAYGVLNLWRRSQKKAIWLLFFSFATTVVFIGGVLSGMPPWARLPGTYLVGADSRSIERESLMAADWGRAHFPINTRLIVDRVNGLLFGAYGRDYIIRSLTDNMQTAPVLMSEIIGNYELSLIRQTGAQYILTDKRLTTAVPELGVYVELGEKPDAEYETPLTLTSLEKFNFYDGINRIFDDGNLVIFDLQAVLNAR